MENKGESLMRIGLYNIDSKKPNLALMKISKWHKKKGNRVSWYSPIEHPCFDKIYASSIFTWSEKDYIQDDVVCGGTGFNVKSSLPKKIDDCEPDYSLYPNFKQAIGFLTRGCIRKCPECLVPEKEGNIRPYRDIEQIAMDRKEVILFDNNVLACHHGLTQIEKIAEMPLRIDFNQGLDARLINGEIAYLLSNVKWIRFIRLACDNLEMLPRVIESIELLNHAGIKPYRIFIYILIKDVQTALIRIDKLRNYGVELFAQAYRDAKGNEPLRILRELEKWVNIRQMFKTHSFEQFLEVRINGRLRRI